MFLIYVVTPSGVQYIKTFNYSTGKYELTRMAREAHAFKGTNSKVYAAIVTSLATSGFACGTIEYPRSASFIDTVKMDKSNIEVFKAVKFVADKYGIETIPTLSRTMGTKPQFAILIANSSNSSVLIGRVEGDKVINEENEEEYMIFINDKVSYSEITRWIQQLL